jgi:hypothetical protein
MSIVDNGTVSILAVVTCPLVTAVMCPLFTVIFVSIVA